MKFCIFSVLIYLINNVNTTLLKYRLYPYTTLPKKKKKDIFDEKGKGLSV